MSNDTTTLNGSLQQLGETMAANLVTKGVTGASASDGLTTLAGKILNVPSGGGGSSNIVQGTFTTGSSRASTGSETLNYNGSGYPIACLVYIYEGAYNSESTYYSSTNRYDVGFYSMAKSVISSTPTYATSSSLTQNQGVVTIIYKNSTTDSASYTRTSNMSAIVYNSSSTNATTTYNCVRFKGSGKNLSYYVGNKGSSTIGLAPSTKYAYIVIYSS